jgi:cysteine desulfurase
VRTIYVDNNATTRVSPGVIEEMTPFLDTMWGNPSSMHSFGGQVGKHVESAREQVAKLLGVARTREIIFTSCGTESDNTAINSMVAAAPDKRRFITTNVEHPAVLAPAKHLAEAGYDVVFLPVNGEGQIDIADLESAINDDTVGVSIMWANNETGVIFPIEEIAEICAKNGVPLHVDAVQAAGKIPIDLSKTPITYLAISGHKIHATKGIGALYVRRGTKFTPLLRGGHQERGRRGGTENTAGIVGFGKACEEAIKDINTEATEVAELRDRLESGILEAIPRCQVHGDREHRLPNTTNIGFEAVEGEAILLMLNEFGICASSGSACTSGSLDPSHVMMAMGVPFSRAHGSIRFSLSKYNSVEDVDLIIEKLPGIIKHLRKLSPIA